MKSIIKTIPFLIMSMFLVSCDSATQNNHDSKENMQDNSQSPFETFDISINDLGENYQGTDIKTIITYLEHELVKNEFKGGDERGEFETLEEFNNRVSNYNPIEKAFRVNSSENLLWAFTYELIGNESKYNIDGLKYDIAVKNLLILSKSIKRTTDKVEKYIAKNAFGVEAEVTKTYKTDFEIESDFGTNLGFRNIIDHNDHDRNKDDKKYEFSRSYNLSVEQAKKVKGQLSLLFIVNPVSPWLTDRSYSEEPTLNKTFVDDVTTYRLQVNLREIWLYNRSTGEVYAKWNKEEEVEKLVELRGDFIEIRNVTRGLNAEVIVDNDERGYVERFESGLFNIKDNIKITQKNYAGGFDDVETLIYMNGKKIEPDWKIDGDSRKRIAVIKSTK